jgi:hypothetical protein
VDRIAALGYVRPYADKMLAQVQRTLDDTGTGYGPAIDAAFLVFGIAAEDSPTTPIPVAQEAAARPVLRASTYDLVLASAATLIDHQVDAPLTNIKASQFFRQVRLLRDEAWLEAATLGYGPATGENFRAHRWDMDYQEPGTLAVVGGSEF